MSDDIKCPFCGVDGYDLIGLKSHLTGGGMFGSICEAMENVETFQQERERRAKEEAEEPGKS